MNGVEILSVTEIAKETTFNCGLCVAILFSCIILGVFFGSMSEASNGAVVGCSVGLLVGLFFFFIIAACTTEILPSETQYKVTVDDSVSMNEFLNKYEIIDKEGKIYTVREK